MSRNPASVAGEVYSGLRINAVRATARSQSVKILVFLTETFIAAFGITRPRPEQEKLANLVIGGFLLVCIVGAFGVVGYLVYTISAR
jgi:hypothetical protein